MNTTTTHAGCVVFRDDGQERRYLVVSSSSGKHWVLPKGHIKKKESPEQAALRELREEAGVLGKIIQPLSIQSQANESGEETIVQYYLVKSVGTVTPEEDRVIRWEEKQSVMKLLSFQSAQNAFQEALEAIEKIR